jgi:hypothetical protein
MNPEHPVSLRAFLTARDFENTLAALRAARDANPFDPAAAHLNAIVVGGEGLLTVLPPEPPQEDEPVI